MSDKPLPLPPCHYAALYIQFQRYPDRPWEWEIVYHDYRGAPPYNVNVPHIVATYDDPKRAAAALDELVQRMKVIEALS